MEFWQLPYLIGFIVLALLIRWELKRSRRELDIALTSEILQRLKAEIEGNVWQLKLDLRRETGKKINKLKHDLELEIFTHAHNNRRHKTA